MNIVEKPKSTKAIVLEALARVTSPDGYVSGEELALKYALSRVAIWKAVALLRKEGIAIEGRKNKGYRLVSKEEPLRADLIAAQLQDDSVQIAVFDTIDSTNTEAKRRCISHPGHELHRSVIVAVSQTAGRGRLGRAFYSPAKSGVYLSIIYMPPGGVKEPAAMTATAAVAVCRAIQTVYGIDPSIKWVNDIFYNGRKVCGILTEGITNFETGTIDTAIIGIGINITDGKQGFPEEIQHVAGSILGDTVVQDAAESHESRSSRNVLVAQVIKQVLAVLDSGTSVMEEYKQRSLVIGQKVTVSPVIDHEKEDFVATVIDIDEKARLIVEDADGKKIILNSGEISLHSDSFSS
ncbi:MAG: biotin--[acetyl-CoA-carboxylase] ligase [Treponema sp.]|nr:biotin--[acetyl-CoA-carboxylase] ligase [Treponema sp.]